MNASKDAIRNISTKEETVWGVRVHLGLIILGIRNIPTNAKSRAVASKASYAARGQDPRRIHRWAPRAPLFLLLLKYVELTTRLVARLAEWYIPHISTTATRARIKAYDLDSQLAGLNAVTGETTEKQTCYWGYWLQHLKTIKLDADPFLSGFSRGQKHQII